MEKNRVTVLVAGQKLTILSEDPENYVIDLAAKIDARITALTMKNMTREKAAVLTALDFADDMEKDKKAQAEIKEQIKDYIREISELSAECESLKAQADKLREEKDKERHEKEALQKIVKDLQTGIETFREQSAKMVKPAEEEPAPALTDQDAPAEEPIAAQIPDKKPQTTDDGDLSFDFIEEEQKPVHTPTPSAPKKKRHEHNHETPYKQQYMKRQEEKGYTPQRQYSLFDDEKN